MATEPKSHYLIYELRQSEGQIAELEDHIRNGRAEYVAGYLIGKLKTNYKIVMPKSQTIDPVGSEEK